MSVTKRNNTNPIPGLITKIAISIALVIALVVVISGLMLLYVWTL